MSKTKTRDELDKMLNSNTSQNTLFRFAYCEKDESQLMYFRNLQTLAEDEVWTTPNKNKELDILSQK